MKVLPTPVAPLIRTCWCSSTQPQVASTMTDLGDHDTDPGDHDGPIHVITMRRSA
jgi:hypothetical protein